VSRLHHVGYWVDDLATACTQWTNELDVGPFDVIDHIAFEAFELSGAGEVVFDHSSAFAAWGPVVVELSQVHTIDEQLAAAYSYRVGAISHVSWVVDDLAAETARLTDLGCRLINTARSGPISVAWHSGGPLFPHPIELHQRNDVIDSMHQRLVARRTF